MSIRYAKSKALPLDLVFERGCIPRGVADPTYLFWHNHFIIQDIVSCHSHHAPLYSAKQETFSTCK